jgi:hypothetical protein
VKGLVAHVVVDVLDQALLERETDWRRQERLRHAVSHVDPGRIAPFGDDVALVDDEAGGAAAILDRAMIELNGSLAKLCA